jgi:glycosyltransferase involved in cell wall biosynthesis
VSDHLLDRILFVQVANPGAYPPLIHAAMLTADAGWEVTFLSAPIAGDALAFPEHPRIRLQAIRARPSHIVRRLDYALFTAAAMRIALRLRPRIVYASDPLGAGPGLVAARLAGAKLVYHEHDSPYPEGLHPLLLRLRAAAARSARLVVLPNEERARLARAELGCPADRWCTVRNVPRRAEIVMKAKSAGPPLVLHYHGSICPERLPETVVVAVRQLQGQVRLRIAGYEAPSARGYVRRLLGDGPADRGGTVEFIGAVPQRSDLLEKAAEADVGLALMPRSSGDRNMQHMVGASNKPFDYMAVGLAMLVSDLPDWQRMYVEQRFAIACDPDDVGSVSAALRWLIDHPDERRAMGSAARARIERDWNYDTEFKPVLELLVAK